MNEEKHSHYKKDVEHLQMVDVYRVLDLYNVTDPALQHAVKKLLVAGGRGAGKDISQDVQEAIDSLQRWQQMQVENAQRGQVILSSIRNPVFCPVATSTLPDQRDDKRRTPALKAAATRKRKSKSR